MTNQNGLIVVTGASRGIGRALAARYAAAGHPVLAISRSGSAPAGAGITPFAADLTRPEEIARIAARVTGQGMPVAVLIHNAGAQHALDLTAPAEEGPEDPIGAEIALNLAAPIRLTRALLPAMRRPGGAVVNVTSLVSRHPKPSAPVYSATKAGLASFTAALRHQLAPLGLQVTEAVPPLVATDMTAGRGRGKITAEAMAQAIFDGVARRRPLVAPGLSRRVLILNRLLPGLVARILSRG